MAIRKVSPTIQKKLKSIKNRYIEVGCARTIGKSQIQRGEFAHLGIRISKGEVVHPEEITPDEAVGTFSDHNVNGFEVIRKDLPKETHYRAVETPNWGDHSRGTHTVHLPYKKYPRDMFPPRLATIEIRLVGTSQDGATITYRFRSSDALDKQSPSYAGDLLEVMNFVHENVGCHDVAAYDADVSDYLKELRVSWEILPPGTLDDVVKRVFRGRKPTKEERDAVEDRYKFLMRLKPKNLIYGTSGLQRYFGAQISEELVVFENIRYGNAIYVMFEHWKELSKKSRLELLSGRFGSDFVRIVHTANWKKRVIEAVNEALDR